MRRSKNNPLQKLGLKVQWKKRSEPQNGAAQSSCSQSGCNCNNGRSDR